MFETGAGAAVFGTGKSRRIKGRMQSETILVCNA